MTNKPTIVHSIFFILLYSLALDVVVVGTGAGVSGRKKENNFYIQIALSESIQIEK